MLQISNSVHFSRKHHDMHLTIAETLEFVEQCVRESTEKIVMDVIKSVMEEQNAILPKLCTQMLF